MKKLLALSAITLSVSAVAHAATPTQQINISGEVRAQTCVLDGASHQYVRLDPIKLSDLEKGTTNAKEFSVNLKSCDVKSTESVYVAFDTKSTNISADGNLKNTQGNSANTSTGVEIQILSASGAKIDLNDPLQARSNDIVQRNLRSSNGAYEFKFQAGYVAEKGAVPTTGKVTSSIPVILQYQ